MDPKVQTQYDYAWKWFDLHAKQRITMFNYFLVVTGILANAYVNVLNEGSALLAAGIGALGCLTSVVFIFFDRRNRTLVHLAEEVLRHIEKRELFKCEKLDEAVQDARPPKVDTQLG